MFSVSANIGEVTLSIRGYRVKMTVAEARDLSVKLNDAAADAAFRAVESKGGTDPSVIRMLGR